MGMPEDLGWDEKFAVLIQVNAALDKYGPFRNDIQRAIAEHAGLVSAPSKEEE